MGYRDTLRAALKGDEGERLKLYRCTAGKLTIGVGRNLEDKGIRPDEMALMLENDMNDSERDVRAVFAGFDTLTDARKAVLCNMAFNMGRDRLAQFKGMLSAMGAGNWSGAADEMLDSLWARQVGNRAKRLANEMRAG